jgi:hypothetical protein
MTRQIHLHTRLSYRGLPVAIVMREDRRDLVAVAGIGTCDEIALATLWDESASPGTAPSLEDVVRLIVQEREARDGEPATSFESPIINWHDLD